MHWMLQNPWDIPRPEEAGCGRFSVAGETQRGIQRIAQLLSKKRNDFRTCFFGARHSSALLILPTERSGKKALFARSRLCGCAIKPHTGRCPCCPSFFPAWLLPLCCCESLQTSDLTSEQVSRLSQSTQTTHQSAHSKIKRTLEKGSEESVWVLGLSACCYHQDHQNEPMPACLPLYRIFVF